MVYECPICHRLLKSEKSMKAHVHTNIHLKAVAAQELTKLESMKSELTKLINTYKKIKKKPTISALDLQQKLSGLRLFDVAVAIDSMKKRNLKKINDIDCKTPL